MDERLLALGRLAAAALALAVFPAGAWAQLFENLEAYGSRLPAGDPQMPSGWPSSWYGREGPKGIVSGDLDGDGDADLAASNLDGTITVYLNLGEGKFSPPFHLSSEVVTLRGIIAADLTGDGRLDLAAAAPLDAVIVIFAARGGGAFEPPRRLEAWSFARNLAAGDFDGDGILDLAAAGPNLGLRHWRGKGGGELEPAAELRELDVASGSLKPVYSLKSWRRRGVNRDELLVTHAYCPVLWALAAGAEGKLEIRQRLPVEVGTFALELGAILGPASEGLPDLVLAHKASGTVSVRRGLAAPGLFSPQPQQVIQVPGGPRALSLGDLDGDGWNDLAVVLRCLDRVVTYQNERGTLAPANETPVGVSPRELVAAELTGDGQLDHAVINRVSSDISVLAGFPGQAGFGALDQMYLVDGEVAALKLADLDGDGRDDVVLLHRASADLSVRLAGPEGLLSPPVFHSMGSVPNDLRLIDADGDGHLDALSANIGCGREPGSISVRLGDGAGGFGPERRYELPPAVTGQLFALEAADFDGDGVIDLAAGFFDCRLSFFRGTGGGGFEFTRSHLFAYEARAMVSGDFDQDGDIDLAGASATGAVVVVENLGDLTSAAELRRRDYEAPSEQKFGTESMLAKDLSGDGDLDLAVGSGYGLMIYLGSSGMNFVLAAETLPGTETPATDVASGDFDGDGSPDLAASCRVLACVTLLTRSPAGMDYLPALSVRVPAGKLIASGDLDGDGHADLVGAGEALWTALSGRRAQRSGPPRLEGERTVIPGVVINEILAVNNRHPLASDGGRKPDWVELYNGGSEAAGLAGWKLSLEGSSGDPQVHSFAPDAVLPAAGYLLVVFSNARRSPYHTGFRLPGEGGVLALLDASGGEVDRVAYPPQRENLSYGRYRDGLRAFVFNNYPSAGAPNADNGPVAPIIRLTAVTPAWSSFGEPLTVPQPGQPLRFFARGEDDVGIVTASILYERSDLPGSEVQRIILYDDGMHGDGGLQDGIFSGVLASGLPAGAELRLRLEAVDLSDNAVVLPGDEEGSAGAYRFSVGGRFPRLELSEVVGRNDSGLSDEHGGTPDWVEIHNCSAEPVPLGGIFLGKEFPSSEDWYAFPAGEVLAPDGRFVVFCDGNGEQGPRHAPFTLRARGDRLVLAAGGPSGAFRMLDIVEYGPLGADVAFSRQGCGGGWVVGPPTPGAPNRGRLVAFGDADSSGSLTITDPIVILGHLFRGELLPCYNAADANRDGRLDLSDPIYLLAYLFTGGAAPPEGETACR
jgi:hypothetical protein